MSCCGVLVSGLSAGLLDKTITTTICPGGQVTSLCCMSCGVLCAILAPLFLTAGKKEKTDPVKGDLNPQWNQVSAHDEGTKCWLKSQSRTKKNIKIISSLCHRTHSIFTTVDRSLGRPARHFIHGLRAISTRQVKRLSVKGRITNR